jgi:hypothetical protein
VVCGAWAFVGAPAAIVLLGYFEVALLKSLNSVVFHLVAGCLPGVFIGVGTACTSIPHEVGLGAARHCGGCLRRRHVRLNRDACEPGVLNPRGNMGTEVTTRFSLSGSMPNNRWRGS